MNMDELADNPPALLLLGYALAVIVVHLQIAPFAGWEGAR